MQTQAELYFRYGEPEGETDFLFTEKFSYYESIEIYNDNSAIFVDWQDEPAPYMIIDRLTGPMVDFLYPERDKHERVV